MSDDEPEFVAVTGVEDRSYARRRVSAQRSKRKVRARYFSHAFTFNGSSASSYSAVRALGNSVYRWVRY